MSGIISGVFLVAVAVMIFNVLAWHFFQYDAYQRVILQRDQREWERFNEKLVVYLPDKGISRLNFTTRNVGSVTAHVVSLYFSFINETRYSYTIEAWVNLGGYKRIQDVGPPLIANDTYYFQIGTERGNLFGPVPEGSGGINNQPSLSQGQPMPFIFLFRYHDFEYLNSSSQWTPGWRLPKAVSEFRVVITNACEKVATIYATQTRLAFYPEDWASSAAVYSVNVGKTGSMTVPVKGEKIVYFGPQSSQFSKPRYYCFIEIFYYLDNPSQIYGTQVGVLVSFTA